MAKTSKKAPTAKTEVTENPAVENKEAEAAPEPVQLTVSDLQILGKIIELASRRGAFQANELSQVGESYNKLALFLAYVDSVQKKEAAATEEEKTETTETTEASA